MNNIFIKNITALTQKNSELASKLQNYIPTDLPQLTQQNNIYNLLYKNRLIHNEINPLAEANEIFAMAENTPTSIHIVYGLGLGYLFQLTSLKSQGTIILYEPDLNILWLAFTLVDFSNDILKPNVYITSDFETTSEYIYKNSGTKNTPVLLSLPSQRQFNQENFDLLVRKLQDIIGSFALDLKFTQQKFYPSLKMLIKNMPNLLKEKPLTVLKDFYKGKTAVVVSAGPTLDKNIENLKKYREKFVLFTVGTAAKTLYANGIKPDFLCIIETYNASRQIEGLDLSDVNFITEPYANPELRKFNFKNVYSHTSSNNPINAFWAKLCGENIEEYLSKGTVSYTALNSARILGFSKIILVGQDLAYIEGQCYSKDSAYKDLVCKFNKETEKWEITANDIEKFAQAISASKDPIARENVAKRRLKNLNNSLYYVKGIKGDMIPTESVYATFIKPLSEYTNLFSDRKYINTSLVGAQIDGFENLSLEEALRDSETVSETDSVVEFNYDKASIEDKLKSELDKIKQVISLINEGKRILKGLNNDIKRYRIINSDILKVFKKLTMNYVLISTELASKSDILDFIVVSDRINLDYEMKMLREFSVENIVNINKIFGLFYENVEKRIFEIERLINESFNTES